MSAGSSGGSVGDKPARGKDLRQDSVVRPEYVEAPDEHAPAKGYNGLCTGFAALT